MKSKSQWNWYRQSSVSCILIWTYWTMTLQTMCCRGCRCAGPFHHLDETHADRSDVGETVIFCGKDLDVLWARCAVCCLPSNQPPFCLWRYFERVFQGPVISTNEFISSFQRVVEFFENDVLRSGCFCFVDPVRGSVGESVFLFACVVWTA